MLRGINAKPGRVTFIASIGVADLPIVAVNVAPIVEIVLGIQGTDEKSGTKKKQVTEKSH